MAADVFISYSREDKDSVLGLATKLREAGVSLWIEEIINAKAHTPADEG